MSVCVCMCVYLKIVRLTVVAWITFALCFVVLAVLLVLIKKNVDKIDSSFVHVFVD